MTGGWVERQDLVLCRSYRGLEKRIAREGAQAGLKASVRYWAGAWEVEEIFQQDLFHRTKDQS